MNFLKKAVLIFAVFYAGYIMFAVVYYLGTNGSSAKTPPPPPICLTGFKNISFHDNCSNRRANTHRKAIFHCYDGSRGEFKSRYCLDEAVFSKAAVDGCNSISKCLLNPIVTSIPSVSPTPFCSKYETICDPAYPTDGCRPKLVCATTPTPSCVPCLIPLVNGACPVRMEPPPGGWCKVTPTPTISVVDDCVWCGLDCVNGPLKPGQQCNLALPPNGYMCKRVAGTCQAVKVTISPLPCPSPPACRGGNLIIGDPRPGSGTVCPQYFCQYPSPIPN